MLYKFLVVHRFAELNLNGIKLNKAVVNSICQLAKTSCLSELMLRDTSIGNVSDFFFKFVSLPCFVLCICQFSLVRKICKFWLMQDGALHLMESLSSETREPVKLDLSFCGLTSQYIFSINDKLSLISGVIELNLGGNPITQEVCPWNHLISDILAKQITNSLSYELHFYVKSQVQISSHAPLDRAESAV